MKSFMTNYRKYVIAALAVLVLAGVTLTKLDDGIAKERKKRGWLGVTVQELTPSLRDALDIGNRTGLLISSVVDESPAHDAGLKDGDVIVGFAGASVEKIKEFTRLVRGTDPGESVKVAYMRDGERISAEVEIGGRESAESSFFGWSGGGDDRNVVRFWGRPKLGVQVHELNESLAGYFDTNENGGVLILEVTEDSPAEKAGLKSGDIITKIDGEKVRDPKELVEALSDYDYEEEVSVEYLRKGSLAKVDVELEASNWRSSSGDSQFFGSPRVFFHRNRGGNDDFNLLIPDIGNMLRWRHNKDDRKNNVYIFDGLHRGNTI